MKKKLAIAAVAAITGFSPILAAPAYADPPRHERGYDRGDRRGDHRAERFDQRRHNGYYYNGRFYRGAPPASYYGRNGFRPAYAQWRRGERVSAAERAHWQRVNYRQARLNAPPRGYEWRRDNTGAYLLVGVATGVILSAILANN